VTGTLFQIGMRLGDWLIQYPVWPEFVVNLNAVVVEAMGDHQGGKHPGGVILSPGPRASGPLMIRWADKASTKTCGRSPTTSKVRCRQ